MMHLWFRRYRNACVTALRTDSCDFDSSFAPSRGALWAMMGF